MNAPWSPSRSGGSNRDPFAAFVCDDNAADLIRPVVVEMGWPVEKVHKGGLRNAVQTLSVAAHAAPRLTLWSCIVWIIC